MKIHVFWGVLIQCSYPAHVTLKVSLLDRDGFWGFGGNLGFEENGGFGENEQNDENSIKMTKMTIVAKL